MSEQAEEARVARGTLAQQSAQVVGVAAMLVVITLVGRTLELAEFGLYGLLISIATYLLIVQTSIEGATVRAIAQSPDPAGRAEIFSLALVLYVIAGAAGGLVIAGVGLAVIGLVEIPEELRHQATAGVIALGALTAIGWPFKVFQDLLRGSQRFLHASVAEVVGHVCFLTASAVLVAVEAPLWTLIAAGASLPALFGLGSLTVLIATRTLPAWRRAGVNIGAARRLLSVSGYLSLLGLADLVLYSIDRLILAAFTSTATVGLYEGAARPHALVRQVHGTLVITVLPVASSYIEAGDDFRIRELLLRGTRYVAAVVVPLAVTLMVLAGPILEVWLGERFRAAGLAMAILVSYWILNAVTGVANSMLVAAGELRWFAKFAWITAALNLVLSIGLTAWLGLEGIMLGTALPYVLLFPVFVAKITRTFGVTRTDLVLRSLGPAWAAGAVAAAVLVGIRLAAEPSSAASVALTAAAGLLAGYGTYLVAFAGENERRLLRRLLGR